MSVPRHCPVLGWWPSALHVPLEGAAGSVGKAWKIWGCTTCVSISAHACAPCFSQVQTCPSGRSPTLTPTRATRQRLKLPPQSLRLLRSPSSAKTHQVTREPCASNSWAVGSCPLPSSLPYRPAERCRHKPKADVERSRAPPFSLLQGNWEMPKSLAQIAELVCICAPYWVSCSLSPSSVLIWCFRSELHCKNVSPSSDLIGSPL